MLILGIAQKTFAPLEDPEPQLGRERARLQKCQWLWKAAQECRPLSDYELRYFYPRRLSDPRLSRLHCLFQLTDRVTEVVKAADWKWGLSETDLSMGKKLDQAGYDRLIAAGFEEVSRSASEYRAKCEKLNLDEAEKILAMIDANGPEIGLNWRCAVILLGASIAGALWHFTGVLIATPLAMFLLSDEITRQTNIAIARREHWKNLIVHDQQLVAASISSKS